MKKNYKKLLSMLALASMTLGMNAESLLVGDSTVTNAYAPLHSTYHDTPGTVTQTIYPAELLTAMVGKNINAVTFYVNDDGLKMSGGLLRLSMGETSQTYYETTADLVTDLQEVASVAVPGGAGVYEVTFTFDTPYTYAGGNLVFESYVTTAGSWAFTYFLGKNNGSVNNVITRGSLYSFIPKTNFDYGDPAQYAARVDANSINFGKVRASESVTKTVKLTNCGLQAFTPTFTTEAPFSVTPSRAELAAGEAMDVPVTFAPTADGLFEGTLNIDCGEAGTFDIALNGYAKPEGKDLTVCDETVSTSNYVPFYQYYSDTPGAKSQMIYPAEMLEQMAGGEILGVTFYPTAGIGKLINNMKVYALETEQSEYTREATFGLPDDMITGLTEVATVSYAAGEEIIEVEFDAPFKYNGMNLAIQTEFTENCGWVQTNFAGAVQDHYSAWYRTTSDTSGGCAQFLPKATFSYRITTPTGLTETIGNRVVKATRYYNLAGMSSDKPFDGVNIIVTEYTDGTRSSAKVIR